MFARETKDVTYLRVRKTIMDYDSESSLENGRKKRDEDSPRQEEERRSSWRLVNTATGGQPKVPLGASASKALSSQVMEYYQK